MSGVNQYTSGHTNETTDEAPTPYGIKGASVIIHRGKAYIPVEAKIEGGPYVAVEPVYEAALTEDAVVAAFEKVIASGHPQMKPPLLPVEWRLRKDPVLAATGARSWRQLDKVSAFYGIWWHDGQVTLYLHPLDQDREPLIAADRVRTFADDASVREIVQTILDDVRLLSRVGPVDYTNPQTGEVTAHSMRIICR
jgi:hypothetical protein